MIKTIKRLLLIRKLRPVITLSDSGWKTGGLFHQLHVGIASRGGSTTIHTYRLDPDGPQTIDAVHAQAEMRAEAMSHILGLRVIDKRPTLDEPYRRHAPKDWHWVPRDQAFVDQL